MTMERERLLGRLMRLALSAAGHNIDSSVGSALRLLGEYAAADRVCIYAPRPDNGLRKSFEWTRPGIAPLSPTLNQIPALALAPWRNAIKAGPGLTIPRSVHHSPFGDATMLLVPMLSKDVLSGVITLENPALPDTAPDDPEPLGMISDLIQTLTQQAVPRADTGTVAGDPDLPEEIRNAALWAMPDLVFELDSEGRFTRVISPDTPRGREAPEAMVGSLVEEVLPADIARDLRAYIKEIDSFDRIQGRIQKVTTASRDNMWYEVSGSHCPPRRRGDKLGYLLVMRDITARIEAEAELRRLGRIVELMTNLVVIVDLTARISWANKAFEQHTGHRLEDIRGQDYAALVTGKDSDRDTSEKVFKALRTGAGVEGETIHYDSNGTPYWVTFNMQPLADSRGQLSGFVFVETVITKQRELEIALRNERDFLSALTETSVSAIVVCDARGKCIFANSGARALLDGFSPQDSHSADTWPFTALPGDDPAATALPFAKVARTGKVLRDLTFALADAEPTRRVFSVNATPLDRQKKNGPVVISLTDVTAQHDAAEARQLAAAKSHHDATHDPLTGLPNRRHFNLTLGRVLAGTTDNQNTAKQVTDSQIHVLVVDMDKFKRIRTVLGQDIGDALICLIAQRIGTCLGQDTMLSRTASDCFVALVQTSDPKAAEATALRICDAISQPCEMDDMTVYVTASIGISRVTDRTVAPEALVRQAELAIEAAKTGGGNRHAFYSPSMESRISRSSEIVQALRLALQKGEFELAFQPKFSLAPGNKLVGAEALLRLDSSRLGRIGPDEFIPVAEAAGMISEIDFHVMGIFARQMGRWHRQGHAFPASLNISPRSFENSTLAPRFLEMLARENVAANFVTVEITETALVSGSGNALANIERFRQGGVSISVDDFGTGYSSLSYLQRLIASEVKIDRSFIEPLTSPTAHPQTEVLLRAILALAKSFGLKSVAEGVENVQQMNWLRDEGCLMIQGYLGGRAVSPEIFEHTHLRHGAMQLSGEDQA